MPDTALRPLTAAEAALQLGLVDISGPSDEIAQLIGADGTPLWWLSFVDPDIAAETPEEEVKPGGPAFLGVAIVGAPTVVEAVVRSHELGVNPGGQVKCAGPIPYDAIAPEWQDRLLSNDEADSIPEPQIEAALARYAERINARATPNGCCPACGFASFTLACSKCGHVRPGRHG